MGETGSPALTPEQWEARDYRQPARELDRWAEASGRAGKDDSTEYVAKLGLSDGEAVVAMNRAHDRVLIPTPARPALAALALADQPFGFTPEDVRVAEDAAERASDEAAAGALRRLADKIQRLLPPR
jgi:hypothetical protein